MGDTSHRPGLKHRVACVTACLQPRCTRSGHCASTQHRQWQVTDMIASPKLQRARRDVRKLPPTESAQRRPQPRVAPAPFPCTAAPRGRLAGASPGETGPLGSSLEPRFKPSVRGNSNADGIKWTARRKIEKRKSSASPAPCCHHTASPTRIVYYMPFT